LRNVLIGGGLGQLVGGGVGYGLTRYGQQPVFDSIYDHDKLRGQSADAGTRVSDAWNAIRSGEGNYNENMAALAKAQDEVKKYKGAISDSFHKLQGRVNLNKTQETSTADTALAGLKSLFGARNGLYD
jgi:hypothetical protein